MMVRNYIQENKGKSLLIAGIVLMWLALGILFKGYGYAETWQLWNVPTNGKIAFVDFRLIPGSAESFRQGFEPTIKNPFDPAKRIFNYPTFWRLFFYTDISMDDTIWIVILMLVLYFFSVMLFPQKITIFGAILMLLVVFSPASMLLYERGNVDLIVFFICVMIILVAGYSSYLAAGLIIAGAVVKMFPLFGVSIFLKDTKQKFIWFVSSCIVFMVAYSVLTFDSQSAAWNTTMRGDGLSYGTFVIITRLGGYFQQALPNFISITQWQLFFEVLALLLIGIAGLAAVRRSDGLAASYERNLAAFRMGASIYLGTFLLGNNWDYRLAFLVLVIPQLSEWFHLENKKQRSIIIGVVIAVLISCWHLMLKIDLPFLPLKDPINRNFVFDEIINWLLVPGFTYLLVASLPEWLKQDLQKVFGVRKSKLA